MPEAMTDQAPYVVVALLLALRIIEQLIKPKNVVHCLTREEVRAVTTEVFKDSFDPREYERKQIALAAWMNSIEGQVKGLRDHVRRLNDVTSRVETDVKLLLDRRE